MVYLNCLAWGLGSFAAVFFAHLVVWRTGRVQREMLWLFLLFLFIPIVAAVMAVLVGVSIGDVSMTLLLYLAVAAAYIQTYPALKEDIPSFQILLCVYAAERGDTSGVGVGAEEVVATIGGTGLVTVKLDELNGDRLLSEHKGEVVLAPAGRVLALFFYYYRRLLGLAAGKG